MYPDQQVRQEIRSELLRNGFVPAFESTAVMHFVHQHYPGAIVRMGNIQIVAERDGVECYRSSLAGLNLPALLAELTGVRER